MKTKWILGLLLLCLISTVSAASSVTTDRLNFWSTATHTVVMTNGEGSSADLNATMPAGFTFGTSSSCTNPSGQIVYCPSIANGATATFTMNSPSSGVGEYEVLTMTSTAGATSLPTIKFVRIKDSELFLTLVEYGRGKGNYFYSSQGRAGSGQQIAGYNFIPENTAFELNYLHKIYPTIGNYLGVPMAEGSGVALTCQYPNATLSKHHLATSVTMGSPITISYATDILPTSWERLMWAVESFDAGQHVNGDTITITCTNIHYYLPDAYGNVSVTSDSFNLEFASKTPITVSATSDPSTIYNGTSEVDITYVLTNTETYPLSISTDPVRITILSPLGGKFVGVKGELFGEAKTEYDLEISELDAGESYTITLTSRFDTSLISDPTINLSRGVEVEFVPPWEINSYNPMSTRQSIPVTNTIAVNYGQTSAINGVIQRLDLLQNTTNQILSQTTEINNTINTFTAYLVNINGTVTSIKTDTTNIYAQTTQINQTANNIYVETQAISEQLDCDTVADTPICQYVSDINNTVSNLNIGGLVSQLNEINSTTWLTYNTMQSNFSQVFNNFNTLQTNITEILTEINIVQDYLNCTISSQDSVCYRLQLLETYANSINSTVINTQSTVNYITNTQLPNINSSVINAINNINISSQIAPVITKIRQLKEFQEESIYLITDSMVEAADNAMKSMDAGNTGDSIKYLEQTQTLLGELNSKIDTVSSEKITALKVENGLTTSTIEPQGLLARFLSWLNNLFTL